MGEANLHLSERQRYEEEIRALAQRLADAERRANEDHLYCRDLEDALEARAERAEEALRGMLDLYGRYGVEESNVHAVQQAIAALTPTEEPEHGA